MSKILFYSDYLEGCHPEILRRLTETNLMQTPGYGVDDICDSAKACIRSLCGIPEADVHFLVGGTQTNATVIASILRPHQGVLCASSGHINVHETGAIEHSGHKVLPLPATDGKISAAQVAEALDAHFTDPDAEHMVQPAMLYISFPTELGTTYTKAELTALSETCRAHGIPMFIDGARLGYGLESEGCDVTIKDIAALADIFYIGGTKQGALFGEAVVICNPALTRDFRYFIKQNGGMLAKGRLLGIQFETLLGNGLYFEIARRADRLAGRIAEAFEAKGCDFLVHSTTNQVFPILTQDQIEALRPAFGFERWQIVDKEHTGVRFCTSWATTEEQVDALIKAIEKL